MPNTRQEQEVLVIRGRLDRGDAFVPGRCASTFYVRRWPEVGESAYVVELLDGAGRTVGREGAEVVEENRCDPGEAPRFRLTAYVPLRPEAATVQIRHDDRVLWRRAIPELPSLDARLASERVSRDAPVRLGLRFSPPEDGAYVQVMYQWGEGRFASLDIRPPGDEIAVDLAARPGGDACRLVVIYSNGLRAAVAATPEFALEPLGPAVTIHQPPADAALVAGQPLILQGLVLDPERAAGARPREDLVWLVDGDEAGREPVSGVDSLEPGRHSVVLRYMAGAGVDASVTVTVTPADVPAADEWAAWDAWADDPIPRAPAAS